MDTKDRDIRRIAARVAGIPDTLEGGEFGGPGAFVLPPEHRAGLEVPKGGSCCANCKFAEIKEDGPHCNNVYWIRWNGGESRLPVDDPETYCSDWWAGSGA